MTNESAKKQFEIIKLQLVDMLSKMESFKGRVQKDSVLMPYLYLKDKYTQSELKRISNLSLGTISNVLRMNINDGYVKKEKAKDATTGKIKYYYSATGNFISDFMKLKQKSMVFIKKIMEKLQELKQELKSPDLKNKNGYQELDKFCTTLEKHLEAQLTGGT